MVVYRFRTSHNWPSLLRRALRALLDIPPATKRRTSLPPMLADAAAVAAAAVATAAACDAVHGAKESPAPSRGFSLFRLVVWAQHVDKPTTYEYCPKFFVKAIAQRHHYHM